MSDNLFQTIDSLKQLSQGRLEAPQRPADAGLTPQMVLLRSWQMERLTQTHADLLASERYGLACRFFLSDLYAPQDFTLRDQGFQKLYHSLQRFLPPPLLGILRDAIDLNDLTRDLDDKLLAVLIDELGMTDILTSQMYAEAYRRCDNYDDRVRQIEMLVEVGRKIDGIVRLPFIGLALRLAHTPAHRAGWGPVHDFLERGYAAFKQMKYADEFLEIIHEREMQILEQIFRRCPVARKTSELEL
jgi:hypothetical protein